jgi:hypothetical protein
MWTRFRGSREIRGIKEIREIKERKERKEGVKEFFFEVSIIPLVPFSFKGVRFGRFVGIDGSNRAAFGGEPGQIGGLYRFFAVARRPGPGGGDRKLEF